MAKEFADKVPIQPSQALTSPYQGKGVRHRHSAPSPSHLQISHRQSPEAWPDHVTLLILRLSQLVKDSPFMERAATVFGKTKQPRSILSDEQVVRAVWRSVVGRAISDHTSRLRLVRTTLVVEVEDLIWQRQLRTLEGQIRDRIRLLASDVRITDIEFRVAVPRREVQRASASCPAEPKVGNPIQEDEADRIKDPVLRKVYQISRRKASA
jgi:Dna[CI] antecedent, DciA